MIGFIPGLATGVSGLMATPDGSSRERILPDMRYLARRVEALALADEPVMHP